MATSEPPGNKSPRQHLPILRGGLLPSTQVIYIVHYFICVVVVALVRPVSLCSLPLTFLACVA